LLIENQIIEIGEFQSIRLKENIGSKDVAYLKKACFGFGDKARSPYWVRELKDDVIEIENTCYAGIIQLEKVRLHFSPKVGLNLFYILSYLKDKVDFYYDPERIISIKEGHSFFDILGSLFVRELKKIFQKGFYKKYIEREENISFLRGKLVPKGQFRNEVTKKPKLFCNYDDLTYDNLENRIILRAATLLISLIKFNENLKRELIRYSNILKNEVTLINVNPDDCDKVQFNKLNDYYEDIIQLSKTILRYYFIRSSSPGLAKGFNFIANMNKVYEDFITAITSELIAEEFKKFSIESQRKFDSLVKEKKIITRPDIIIRKNDSHEYPIIIDAKYKRQENNADYYQVITYALAIPSTEACFLIYPGDEEIETEELTIDLGTFGQERKEIKIFSIKVDLWREEKINFIDYINDIKNQLKKKFYRTGYF